MTVITILEKAYGSFSAKAMESELKSLCRDLKVALRFKGKTTRDWIEIELTGEDEPVALRLLDREIGLAPVSADRVAKFSSLRGMVIDTGESGKGLLVDVGVTAPKVCDALVPHPRLKAQLTDGKDLPMRHIIELYGFFDYMPLQVKIIADLSAETCLWEAELSERQLRRFSDWRESNLDHLIVLGASRQEVENAVDATKHRRDVIKIESLGLLEHAVECKLGTDAVGLVPSLGRRLRQASLTPFTPRKVESELRKSH